MPRIGYTLNYIVLLTCEFLVISILYKRVVNLHDRLMRGPLLSWVNEAGDSVENLKPETRAFRNQIFFNLMPSTSTHSWRQLQIPTIESSDTARATLSSYTLFYMARIGYILSHLVPRVNAPLILHCAVVFSCFRFSRKKNVYSASPGKESCSLSMGITLGEKGEIVDVIVAPSLVKVGDRFFHLSSLQET